MTRREWNINKKWKGQKVKTITKRAKPEQIRTIVWLARKPQLNNNPKHKLHNDNMSSDSSNGFEKTKQGSLRLNDHENNSNNKNYNNRDSSNERGQALNPQPSKKKAQTNGLLRLTGRWPKQFQCHKSIEQVRCTMTSILTMPRTKHT